MENRNETLFVIICTEKKEEEKKNEFIISRQPHSIHLKSRN